MVGKSHWKIAAIYGVSPTPDPIIGRRAAGRESVVQIAVDQIVIGTSESIDSGTGNRTHLLKS